MKVYIDKAEVYYPKTDRPFRYEHIDYNKILKDKDFYSVISRNLMIVSDSKVYYSFLLEPNPYLNFLKPHLADEQKLMFLPINDDNSKKDYCEVSIDFILEYLNYLLKDRKMDVSSIIQDIEKLN